MRRLVLHIGSGKTGTTTLQLACTTHAGLLSKAGWHYPNAGRPQAGPVFGHHLLPFLTPGRRLGGHAQRWLSTPEAPPRAWEALLDEISAHPDKNILLSSEEFWFCRPEGIEFIQKTLAEFEITIVLYLRNPLDYLVSLYKQTVRSSGYSYSFSRFREERLHEVIYTDLIRPWETFFGRDHIRICLYNKVQQNEGLVDHFFHLLNLTAPLRSCPNQAPQSVNISPSDSATLLMRRLNQIERLLKGNIYHTANFHPLRIRIVSENGIGRLLNSVSRFLTPGPIARKEDIDWLRSHTAEPNQELFENYFQPEDARYFDF